MGSCKFCFFVVPILYKMKNTSLIFILTILSFQSKIFIIFLNQSNLQKNFLILKMQRKVHTATLLVLLLFISGTEQRECFKKGECKESFQITGSVLDNQYECRKACQSSMSCAWFTYFQRTSYCQLYKNCFRIDPSSCKECLSGEKDCSAPELKCWVTGQCKEDPFATNTTTSSEECLEACQLESDCEWFTFDTKDSSCNLHKKCSSLIGCETCISGNTKCRVTSKGIYKFKLKHSTILY